MARMTDERLEDLEPGRIHRDLEDELRRARASEARLLEQLKAIQFGACDTCGYRDLCPECHGRAPSDHYAPGSEVVMGHVGNCQVGAAIRAAEEGA